jgi:hypothetical protein
MAPPITFEAGGPRYIAFMGGLLRPATSVGPNNDKVENPPILFVFGFDGKAEMPKAALPLPSRNQAPAPAPEQN